MAEVLEDANNQSLKFTKSDVLNEWVSTVIQTMNEKESNPILFRQLFDKESSTYSYLLADSVSLDAILIDPVAETVDRDIQLIQELGKLVLHCSLIILTSFLCDNNNSYLM